MAAHTLPRSTPITAGDRLGMTLFLAISFHALVILGISFSSEDRNKPKIISTLDITLVQQKTDKPNKKADYLAQADQQGGGTTKKQVRNTGPRNRPTMDTSHGQARKDQPKPKNKKQLRVNQQVLTSKKADFKVTPVEKKKKEKRKTPSTIELIRRSREIARLTAKNEAMWQAYSRRPDSKYLYANTRKHTDAAYLLAWSRKVEKIGNLNYPDAARRRNLSGNLIMEVTLRPNGSLVSIRILKSSNHQILDDAAVRIVKLAAPYARVPRQVMEGRKVLRIVRTWSFTSANELYSR